jgi:two-component system CheB/CheR fusion protein
MAIAQPEDDGNTAAQRPSPEDAEEALAEESAPTGPTTVVVLATSNRKDLDALFAPLTPQADAIFIVTFVSDGVCNVPELPETYGGMPVTVAKEETELSPGVVFVVLPGKRLVATDGKFERLEEGDLRGSARALLGSVMVDRGHRGIVVLLTSNGQSGAALREVKATGGIVLAETRVQYERIVGEGITPNVFDRFVPKQELGLSLLKLLEQTRRLRAPAADDDLARDAATHLDRILTIVRGKTGHDFRQYKRNTIV